jgi:hypothetical protein
VDLDEEPRAPSHAVREARAMSVAITWGTTAAERATPFPGDLPGDPERDVLWRGVDVAAPAALVFRWLCQMRVAPYSYDWIDNRGRRSPQTLTPGLDRLAIGQDVMIFRLVAFEPGASLTMETPPGSSGERLFGHVHMTYWARAVDDRRTRLLVKIHVRPARGPFGAFMRWFLPWGDLVMMRRQLLNFRRLAERDAQNTGLRTASGNGSERSSA